MKLLKRLYKDKEYHVFVYDANPLAIRVRRMGKNRFQDDCVIAYCEEGWIVHEWVSGKSHYKLHWKKVLEILPQYYFLSELMLDEYLDFRADWELKNPYRFGFNPDWTDEEEEIDK